MSDFKTECYRCGAFLSPGDRYCPECGISVVSEPLKRHRQKTSSARWIFWGIAVVAIVFVILFNIFWQTEKTEESNQKATVLRASVQHYQKGEAYFQGKNGYTRDFYQAFNWFRIASEQGHREAQYRLACMYAQGLGVEKNFQEAVLWLHKAAEQGHAEAAFDLGGYYDDEMDNPVEAVKWFRAAAEQGHTDAAYILAGCLETGTGIPKDKKKAMEWYRRAAKKGSKWAQDRLKKEGLTW